MVCDKCESKLRGVVVPDKWKAGAKNVAKSKGGGGGSVTSAAAPKARAVRPSSIKLGKDKRGGLLLRPCRICKTKVHQELAYYCQECAYKKGICCMCGRKVLDVDKYKMRTR